MFPDLMVSRRAWVRADGKRPIQLDGSPASVTDPSTWFAYDDVRSGVGDGFGVMLGDGLGCYDLDRVDERFLRRFVAGLREPIVFVERSVSGRGFHVFVEAPERQGWRRYGIEFYSRVRFIRVTGDAISV